MSLVHLLINPFGEVLLQHGGADVGDPLLRRLRKFQLAMGQVIEDDRVPSVSPIENVFNCESFVPIYLFLIVSYQVIFLFNFELGDLFMI